MPSPFPGMDPFIEGQKWPDFQHGVIEEIRTVLTAQVRPRYVVEVEKHVYVEYLPNGNSHLIEPDAMLLEAERGELRFGGGVATATAVAIQPVLLTAPIPEERRVTFLAVREPVTGEVVTVIEVLSPFNKRSGGRGRRFTTVYDRAGYDYSLDYQHPVEPPLSELDAAWVQERLAALSAGEPA